MPFPDVWIEGRRVGQNTLSEDGLGSRQDRDTLLCYDIRTSIPILQGVRFWIECNGQTIPPRNPDYSLRRDPGMPDVGDNNQNRTLNFVIPAGTGLNQLGVQLFCDTSGVRGYSPPKSLLAQGWMESPWTVGLIPPPACGLKVGSITVQVGDAKVANSSPTMFMGRLAKDLASMCPLRRQLNEIEMIALPPVTYQGWWWRRFFSVSFINENLFRFGLSWRPEVLRFDTAQLGQAVGSAVLETVTDEVQLGRTGFTIRLPQATGLNAGTNVLLRLKFARVVDGWSSVSFSDQPVLLWVSDLHATAVPVSWTERTVYVADVPNAPTLTAPPITPEILTRSGFSFTVIGPRYNEYRTEYSSNLLDWIPLQTDNPSRPEIFITDPGATNVPMRFYRVLMQQ